MLGPSQFVVCAAITVILLADLVPQTNALLRRCYHCRSRGELGSCKDPFKSNSTHVEEQLGVTAVPCASGWCGKVIEGTASYRDDDFDMATQRMCVQRGPSDSEDRCAYTIYNFKKVFMCFCQGDLCNGASKMLSGPLIATVSVGSVMLNSLWFAMRL